MNTHILGAEGAMKKIIRHALVDIEAQEACAPEGGLLPKPQNDRQGRGPLPKVKLPPKPERMRVAKFYRVCAVVVLAIFSALLLVHFGVSR